MTAAHLDLHINELVLFGFASADRYNLTEAMERELTRLFAEQGVPAGVAHTGEIDRLDGGTIQVTSGAGPESVGAHVAGALYRGLCR